MNQATENTGISRAQLIDNQPLKRLFTLKEAGQYLGRSEYSIRCLIWDKHLAVVRSGRKQWVDIRDMDQWIEENKVSEI